VLGRFALKERRSSPSRSLHGHQVKPKPVDASMDAPIQRAARDAFDPSIILPAQQPEFADIHHPLEIDSQFAGLFFLINVFIALDLYGDFSRPGIGLRGLSPFELLLLLGRIWFGRAFKADRISATLLSLSGLRARSRPGRHFEVPLREPPGRWFLPWTRSEWKKAGYKVERKWSADQQEWITALSSYLNARLALSLGISDSKEALEFFVRRPGKIIMGETEICIAFAIDLHPVELRMIGVDRDPGWIPAAGRTMRFEFK
jgi:hypothetical protein